MCWTIFCTRLGGTGGIDEPGVSADIPKWVIGQLSQGSIFWFGRTTLTWSRSRPEVQDRRKQFHLGYAKHKQPMRQLNVRDVLGECFEGNLMP